MIRIAMMALGALMLSGCAAKLTHTEISNGLEAGSAVNGIPYRVQKRFKATVYEKGAKGYEPIHTQNFTMPDPERLYVLGFETQPFSSATIDLILNADNTLQQVSINSTSTGQAALTALGAQVSAITAAEAARRTAEQTRATGELTAATNAQALLIKADKAYQAAEVATVERQVAAANPATTPDKLAAASSKERSAKLDANEAARLAGRPPYYPDVIP